MQQEKIIPILESSKPQLSTEDRVHMWKMIEQTLPVSKPIPSLYSQYLFSNFVNKKYMTAFLIALLIVAGGSGTALASDASRPGDLLFPLERTLENVRLRLAFSEESRTAFENSLTEERLQELREIIDEEIIITSSNIVDGVIPVDITASGTVPKLVIEADAFTDTTVVKIGLGEQKFYFETNARTEAEIIASIQQKFPMLTHEQIVAVFAFEIEDRESRQKDRGIATFSSKGTERVNTAVQEILSFIDKTSNLSDSHRTTLLSVIENEMGDLVDVNRDGKSTRIGDRDSKFEIKMDDDGDSRIEIRNDNTRVRVEQKDGEVRIRTKEESDNERDDDSRIDVATVSSLSIEADIFTDTTIVKVELGNEDFTFETNSDTRDEIISSIQKKLPSLEKEQIDTALSIEVKSRANKPEVKVIHDDSDNDNSSERDDDKYEDSRDTEDEEDDNDDDDWDDEDEDRNDDEDDD